MKINKKLIFKNFMSLFFIININIKFKNIIKINQKYELSNIKKYYKLNNQGILLNLKKFKKRLYPRISIITAVYNREKYILRFIRSIQNQFYDNIEIIFIDDCSTDNSIKIIEINQKKDERIILIKQHKKRGTLITRNIGILKAKGEYIIIPDVDDILSDNILKKCYYLAKRYNYEMIRFNMYSDKPFIFSKIKENLKNIIYQPELSNFILYGEGYLKLFDGIISNKFTNTLSHIYF